MCAEVRTIISGVVLLAVFALVSWNLRRKRAPTNTQMARGKATSGEPSERRRPFHLPFWLGVCLVAAIAVFFLWEEHQAHIPGALPWLILLACPLIHFFMHRNHDHGGGEVHQHGEHGQSKGGSP